MERIVMLSVVVVSDPLVSSLVPLVPILLVMIGDGSSVAVKRLNDEDFL